MKHFVFLVGATAVLVYASTGDPIAQSFGKVDLCHSTGNGQFHKINVSPNASPAHLAHGDLFPDAGLLDGRCQPEPRPLGAVQVDADGIDIGRCFGGDRCIELTVTCPDVENAEGTLRVTEPGAIGTVILTTGGKGTGLFGNTPPPDLNDEFMDAFVEDGYLLVELG